MKLLKIFVFLILALALITGIALPSMAASQTDNQQLAAHPQQSKKDKDGKGSVQVIRGLVSGKSDNVIKVDAREVTVNDKTKYKVPGVKDATFADIKVGMHVVIQAQEENQKLIAWRVGVAPGRSALERHQGKIMAYSYNPPNGGSITIEEKSGKRVTFQIVGDKFRIRPAGATPKVGDLVTVIASNEPPRNELTAVGVVIHYPLLKLSGAITSIDETAKTITVGTTVFKYNDKTQFVLRGLLAVKVGQQATVFYRQQTDGSLLAKRVQITP